MRQLSKKGKDLCSDNYLSLLKPQTYTAQIRDSNQLEVISKFNKEYNFDDDMELEFYFDFKRLPSPVIDKIVQTIKEGKYIKSLTVGGSPSS